MNSKAGNHKAINTFVWLALSVFICAGIVSCEETCYDGEKNNSEEGVDCGGPCVPCDTTNGTCFDGIQNQGEEGVDCGGPCNACVLDTGVLDPNFICEGTGSSTYFPLSVGSYWIYIMPGSQWFQLEITEEVQQGNGETYAHMVTTGAFGTIHDYYREASGVVYEWNAALSVEEVYLPANPTNGYSWTTSGADSIIVTDANATVNSQNGCTYTGVLQITSYNGGSSSTNHYKQGIGLIQLDAVSAYLDSVVVF